MKYKRIKEIENLIDQLSPDLLIPIRTTKTIEKEAFKKLFILLEELKNLIEGEDFISRSLAGLLFFIYTSISSEAVYVRYPNPIIIELGKLQEYLNKILWDSPFGKKR